ncbi:hypothetical protein Pfl04_33250 [Planosporangium flavigriseum]|uniref:MoxR-vWA-beta-propeller ternary system domain-containing protein n=1 Tax=Planosporangium flavigriseum TaxID=373681 RepID=A0A8J3PPD1_9ACTN|nr:hypothetical protein [Planosporangium flavigriseum]GIG74921.1 hypothetical protein Pfl04_33250 [Planosporangium flavigriseum]
MTLRWHRRDAPLPAAAVVASGAVMAELRADTLIRVAAGAQLRVCASQEQGWLIVLGDRAELPWADGAVYLGWDGGVLVPTLTEPWPCADLLREPLRRLVGQQVGLVALLPGLVLAGPLPREPVDPARLDPDV